VPDIDVADSVPPVESVRLQTQREPSVRTMGPDEGLQASQTRAAAHVPADRIVVKEVNWLGDLVMSLPALHALRQGYPQAHLAVLVRSELASFFDGSGWLDEVIPYAVAGGLRGVPDRWRVVEAIRTRRFDLAVVFPKSFEAAFWAALARVPRRAGFVADVRGALLTHKAVLRPALRQRHQTFDYLAMLEEALGVVGSSDPLAPAVHAPARATMEHWLSTRRRRQGRLIALAVAAAYGPAKEWPEDRYAALIDVLANRYAADCVLVGGPAERARCERVAARSQCGALVAAGETTVGELVALCDGCAGNDSGAMHVAAALGRPTVTLFGSTNPQRTGPRGPRSRIIYRQIDCAPCLQRTCRFGHYQCLTQIAPEEVVEALVALGGIG
jgi:heptosyltransferase-2